MNKLKALIVGVSKYHSPSTKDLPFCLNDLNLFRDTLEQGLNVDREDIYICGNSGFVSKNDFIQALMEFTSSLTTSDTLIFYFSGHGTTLNKDHYLVLSDSLISTQEIIEFFEKSLAKTKIVFLDCCNSGGFSVGNNSYFNLDTTVNEFHGKGYAVFASSKVGQYSYGHPDKDYSVFTSFLCDALMDKNLIRKGKLSLNDVHKLTSLYLDIWNKKNPMMQQHPIYRGDIIGTIYFDVEDYQPFYSREFYVEYEDYIIYKVTPAHTGNKKRFKVQVILNKPFTLEEISKIALKVREEVKMAEIYSTEKFQRRFQGLEANIIWIYFGRDENDMINDNYICHTTWVDEAQNKEWWYRLDNKDTFLIDGVHINVHSYYTQLKLFTLENTASKEQLINDLRGILKQMVFLAERVIALYNDYRNEIIIEKILLEELEPLLNEIKMKFHQSTDLDNPPDEIRAWYSACSNLFGTIYEFTYYFNYKYLNQRTIQNRRQGMELAIKKYYEDLNELKGIENKINT